VVAVQLGQHPRHQQQQQQQQVLQVAAQQQRALRMSGLPHRHLQACSDRHKQQQQQGLVLWVCARKLHLQECLQGHSMTSDLQQQQQQQRDQMQ
jgi:hypothetical protein